MAKHPPSHNTSHENPVAAGTAMVMERSISDKPFFEVLAHPGEVVVNQGIASDPANAKLMEDLTRAMKVAGIDPAMQVVGNKANLTLGKKLVFDGEAGGGGPAGEGPAGTGVGGPSGPTPTTGPATTGFRSNKAEQEAMSVVNAITSFAAPTPTPAPSAFGDALALGLLGMLAPGLGPISGFLGAGLTPDLGQVTSENVSIGAGAIGTGGLGLSGLAGAAIADAGFGLTTEPAAAPTGAASQALGFGNTAATSGGTGKQGSPAGGTGTFQADPLTALLNAFTASLAPAVAPAAGGSAA